MGDLFRRIESRIKAAVRSKRGKDVLLYLLFVAVAFVFWVFMSLDTQMQRDFEVPVELQNVPDSVTLITQPPEVLSVSVKGKDAQLLRFMWGKGETSGHFQYVRFLSLDCDNDTILAKVRQVGAACHTGSYSCFFKKLADRGYIETNPLKILEEDYNIIIDRKNNPKEGSYTNYLFDKGIDKILKKCGEEASEIIIAAKNEGNEELKYEIADFLYHMMVLMAECGLDWEDITRELSNRR